jgi:hypothetical protein
MAYRIEGLPPAAFDGLVGTSDGELAAQRAVRVTADKPGAYPCRITLEDAEPGEALLLLNHVSHDVDGPFRASHAIFVREGAAAPGRFEDEVPPMLDRRMVSLRGFDAAGMMRAGLLAAPGEADARIRDLFADTDIATIHAHTAAYGCFLARIERS